MNKYPESQKNTQKCTNIQKYPGSQLAKASCELRVILSDIPLSIFERDPSRDHKQKNSLWEPHNIFTSLIQSQNFSNLCF